MRHIADTIARMTAASASRASANAATPTTLCALDEFGTNPGALKAYVHIPKDIDPGAPLVVVLHGCTQSAERYDQASGWSQLADEQGFTLLYPEQQRGNNANSCFNWFEPYDTRRDCGEVLSIRQMIAEVRARHAIDPKRVFITGLSAGGAMTAAMLANYPEVFAGGAIIAGLPHGIASGMVQAFDRMRGHGLPDAEELTAALRDATDHPGQWPRISIWHGEADATVSVSNATAILDQWRGVHGVGVCPSVVDRIDDVPYRAWHGPNGHVLIEEYIVPGMAHGTPLKTKGAGGYGSAAPYMLDVGISSTLQIARFWGIVGAETRRIVEPQQPIAGPASLPARMQPQRLFGRTIAPVATRPSSGVGKVIDDALRSAGLLK